MLVDTHAHLDDDSFDADRELVIERAVAAGVEKMIVVATNATSSSRCMNIAAQFPSVYASVGIQPNYVHESQPGDWEKIIALADSPLVVALGETGLDRYWDYAPFPLQQDYFDRHLRLSQDRDLPVIIHLRESEADILAMLREARLRGPVRGVMHSYTGTPEGASEAIDLGMYISFAGMLTYKKSQELRDCAKRIPLDRLLVETDSPYLSPEPVRSMRRNEPANVVHTAKRLAELLDISESEIAQATTQNAQTLFRFER